MSGLKFHIPDSWKLSKLPDIAEINMGQSPSSSDVNEHGEGMVFFQGKAEFGKLYPIPRKYCTKPTKIAPAGSILLSVRAPVGPTNIATQTTAIGRGLAAISACDGLTDPKYLLYYFRYIEPWLSTQGTGSTFKAISGTFIKELVAPATSFYEQKIIAEKLDTLLAQVDSTKARLEKIPKILKRFRQAVLTKAMSGKLTTDVVLTQSPLTIGNETSNSPKGWKWHNLTELAKLESGHTPRKTVTEYWENGDIPWISLQDIRAAHGKIINKTKFMPTQKGIDNSSARLLPEGTVCFSRDISVGYTTIMGTTMSTTQHFANWICSTQLNNKYLMFAFMAAKQHLTKSGQGTTVKTIYMPALKELRILTPPLQEQQEIVRRIEQLFAYADTIEKQVNNALTRVNNLTQSILAKAFRGELTAQWRAENPDLISGENSAAALLEKIKAERAASGSKKAPRKKT